MKTNSMWPVSIDQGDPQFAHSTKMGTGYHIRKFVVGRIFSAVPEVSLV